MATVKKFECLEVWQLARTLLRKINALVGMGSLSRNFVLRDQMYRAALSILLNICEGFGRRTDLDLGRFLTMAHGSVAELQGCLYASLDARHIRDEQFQSLYSDTEQIGKMIISLSHYLRSGTGKTV